MSQDQVITDPGIGFGKTFDQNVYDADRVHHPLPGGGEASEDEQRYQNGSDGLGQNARTAACSAWGRILGDVDQLLGSTRGPSSSRRWALPR